MLACHYLSGLVASCLFFVSASVCDFWSTQSCWAHFSFAFMIDCAVVAPEAFLLAPAVVACHSLSLSIDRGSGVTAPIPQYTEFLPCYVHSG